MLSALNAAPIEVSEVSTPRANEVHCRVAAAAVKGLADFAWKQLESELILMLADDRRQTPAPAFAVHYLFANRRTDQLLHASTYLDAGDPRLPSLAPFCYPASRFEREIRDLFGIRVVGHPDPRPLVKHGFWPEREYPLRKDARISAATDEGQPFPFTAVGGEGVYEIPVGPVHAGVIEPGHFRFNVMGETIIDMKTRLYFTHKGTEKLFEGRDPSDGVELAERISGDTSVGHPLAYCQAIESAAGVEVPLRARLLRVVFLELERLYNHIGDYGAMANDTGFAIAQAHSLRIRERLLRLNKRLT
ncbi:MAG: formate hydrogenase, partial [Acidobacteria bacterium]